MFDQLDPVLLSRIQFAFTVSFHILFPAFTIGLASWLAVVEALHLKTNHPIYKEIYKFWVKIFAVTFGMGVVSGLVMSYQFGTNWSVFSDKVGNVLGPLLGYEVLTAFFLEASFLGIMLFGWDRVGRVAHFISTLIVAIGTLISAFWILSAISWMHTPAGYSIGPDGRFFAENWFEIVFNPSFPYRFIHMIMAAYLTTAFVVGGVGAWYLYRKVHVKHAKIMFSMAMVMAVFVAPMQMLMGDLHGINTYEHQPQKVMAMEGIWDTQQGAALNLFGVPNVEQERTDYAIQIPKLASLILTHDLNGEVKGLKEWPKEERPVIPVVFYSFRIMVGIGVLMILTGITAAVLFFRKKLFTARWFQLWCMAMTPAGFVAVLTGWFVTESGRQPYVVFNLLRTADVASPIEGGLVGISLFAFVSVYTLIFGTAVYYIIRLIQKGPIVGTWHDAYGQHGVRHPITLADVFPGQMKEQPHV